MKKRNRIRKFLAIALLLAFSISVTPKIYFHDLFYSHTDYSCAGNQSGKIQLTAYKFNCGFVSIEGISPFLEARPSFPQTLPSVLSCFPVIRIHNWIQVEAEHTQHRGPPAFA